MKIEVYIKPGCQYCVLSKELLEKKNISFTSHEIGKDVTVDEVLEKFPSAKTVPIILVDNEWIGGYNDLSSFLREKEK